MTADHWIVMPVHNGRHMTEQAIRSCLLQDIPTRLFVIDNGSTDGAAQMLATFDPKRVTTVHYMPQKGVSYAWNRALDYVFSHGAEHALVVNSDVVLRPDSYRRLLEDGGEFVTLVGSSDPECIASTTAPDLAKKRPHPDFSAYLMRRSIWQRVGAFDESMFNYCSDGDMHIRMQRAGIVAYCIDLPFYHIASGTTKVADGEQREWLAAIADRDRATFAAKHGFKMGSDAYYAEFGGSRPDDPGSARA